jgi:hypothetical protein
MNVREWARFDVSIRLKESTYLKHAISRISELS